MGWHDLAKRLEELGRTEAQVGWFDTSKYPDGTPVALVAATHEYGSPKKSIPPRPFIRPAINDGRVEWSAAAKKGFTAVSKGTHSPSQVLNMIGANAAGAVQEKLSAVNSPPLKPSTLAARKRKGVETAKPLFETGLMFTSVSYKVVTE